MACTTDAMDGHGHAGKLAPGVLRVQHHTWCKHDTSIQPPKTSTKRTELREETQAPLTKQEHQQIVMPGIDTYGPPDGIPILWNPTREQWLLSPLPMKKLRFGM